MSMPSTKPMSETGLPEGDTPSRQLTVDALRGRALALLTRREHSRAELRQKLFDQGGNAADIEQVLDELVERKLQSDARFAEVFVRSRAQRGYGPRVIAGDLWTRGLDAEQIDEALSSSGYDWNSQASDARQKRFGRALPEEMRERARQLRFLQYRGFTGAQSGKSLRCEVLEDG
jgi:regulatory protein